MIGPKGARVMIVGDVPNDADFQKGEPFIGGGGYELSKMLQEAGTFREEVLMRYVVMEEGWGSVEELVALKKKDVTGEHVLYRGKHVLPCVVEMVEELKAAIEEERPTVVVPVGNLALWALTGEWSVRNWRSSLMESTLVPGQKVIPTLPPLAVIVQWGMRPIVIHDLKRVVRESQWREIKRVDYSFVIRPDYPTAIEYLAKLIHDSTVCFHETGQRMQIGGDIETRAGHIACIAFARSEKEAICIPLMCVDKADGYWTEAQEAYLVFLIYQLCQTAEIVGQNWNYDAQYILRHWHFTCPEVLDTMIQQHSCFSNMEKSLAFLSSMYCDDHLYWKDDRSDWKEEEGEEQFWRYNCTDAVRTLAISRVLRKIIPALNLEPVNAFQQSLAPTVLRTMDKGIRTSPEKREDFNRLLTTEIEKREEWLNAILGRYVNIKSPKQLQELFYTEFGVRPVLDRATKRPTTNDEALHRIAEREPILKPITRCIAELRSLGVFRSTFVEARLDIDGRLRTSFNICGTETYRFASRQNAFGSGLNMQNIPSGGETEDDGLSLPNVRQLFLPDPGFEFFDIDLDSADLRIVTWEADCRWMKQNFAAGKKPYVEVMREYYQDGSMTKGSHPREYAMFKSLCHGTNYLGTPQGIAPRIGLDVDKVKSIQQWYFKLCPEIRKWQEDVKKQVVGRRWVQNVFGYKLHIFEKPEGNLFNEVIAWIPQSSVGCLINRGYKRIDSEHQWIEVLLQVHDSLAGQYPISRREEAGETIKQAAEVVLPYADPLTIPVGIKTSQVSWGDCV